MRCGFSSNRVLGGPDDQKNELFLAEEDRLLDIFLFRGFPPILFCPKLIFIDYLIHAFMHEVFLEPLPGAW